VPGGGAMSAQPASMNRPAAPESAPEWSALGGLMRRTHSRRADRRAVGAAPAAHSPVPTRSISPAGLAPDRKIAAAAEDCAAGPTHAAGIGDFQRHNSRRGKTMFTIDTLLSYARRRRWPVHAGRLRRHGAAAGTPRRRTRRAAAGRCLVSGAVRHQWIGDQRGRPDDHPDRPPMS